MKELEFTETYLGGKMSCNGQRGSLDSGSYHVKNSGALEIYSPFAVTVQLFAEPEEIMEQETEYNETLMNASVYRIVDNHLELGN